MDKGRTGSQGSEEEPDEKTVRRNRPQRPVRRADGVPNDRRKRPTGSTNTTGRVGPPSGNHPPGPVSRRLPPPPPSDLPGGRPPIRRATRPEYSREELDDDAYPRQPRPPRSRRLANDPDAQPPVRRNPRPQPPLNDPDEEYYEQRPRSRRLPEEDEEEYYERRPRSRRLPEDVEEDEEEYYEQRPRSRRLADPPDRNPPLYRYSDEYDYVDGRSRRKRRRVLPMVLTGCGLIIFTLVLAAGVTIFLVLRSALPQNNAGTTGQVVTQTSTQTLNLTSVTRIQVCNAAGNVTVTTDANASAVTVKTTKTVPQNNPTEASRIKVQVLTSGTMPTDQLCKEAQASTGSGDSPLIIKTDVPDNASVDVTVTLSTNVLPVNANVPMPLNIDAPAGNINISGLSSFPVSVFVNDICGSKVTCNSNIVLNNVILGNGSSVRTNKGNITFNGPLGVPSGANVRNTQTYYHLITEQGNVDVTLVQNPNLELGALANGGKIFNDFLGPDSQGDTYNGLLDPTQPPATQSPGSPADWSLSLQVGEKGDIHIHKSPV